MTRFTSQLLPGPTEAHPDVGLQNVETVFDEFRRRLGSANSRFEEARKEKIELLKTIEELTRKVGCRKLLLPVVRLVTTTLE